MAFNTESRTVNAGKNAISALANKSCILIITLIGRKIFIKYIGVDYLGINGLFANILTLLSMADLGLGTAMNVSLYKPIAENDMGKLAALLNYYKNIYRLIAAAVTVIGFALIPFLQYVVNLNSDMPYIYIYYTIFVLKNTVSYLCIYKSSILNADQKNYLINRVDIYIGVFRVTFQIITVIIFKNYLIYILTDFVFVIIHNLAVSWVADRQYSFLKIKNKLPYKEKRIFLNDICSAFLYKISGSILGGTDNILISIIVSTTAVGLLSNYSTITSNLSTVVVLIFTSMTASVGNMVVTSTSEKRYEIFRMMQMVANWISAYFALSLLFLIQDFIVLWLNEEMVLDSYVLIAIAIDMYYALCMRPVWTFREGTGMYRQIKYIMLLTAAVNIVLSIVLGKYFGIGGILIATSVAKVCTCFLYEPYLLFKKYFKVKPVYYYEDYFKNVAFMVICGIICFLALKSIRGSTFLVWIAKGAVCTVIINGLYLIRYHNTQEFLDVKSKLSGLLKHQIK